LPCCETQDWDDKIVLPIGFHWLSQSMLQERSSRDYTQKPHVIRCLVDGHRRHAAMTEEVDVCNASFWKAFCRNVRQKSESAPGVQNAKTSPGRIKRSQ